MYSLDSLAHEIHNAKILKRGEQTILYKNRKTLLHSYSHISTLPQQYLCEKQDNGNISNDVFKFSKVYAPESVLSRDNASVSPISESICSTSKNLERLQKNFKFCCNPSNCNKIFASIPTPKGFKMQRPFAGLHIYGDKFKKRLKEKSYNPYRTVSHFGFNNPLRDPMPDHKHLAVIKEGQKYVPLRRSVSYEEIFSSARYLNLCENCFEFVVRLKPELIKYKTELRNLKYQKDLSVPAKDVCALNKKYHLCKSDAYEPYSMFCSQLNSSENESMSKNDLHSSTIVSFTSETDDNDGINSLYSDKSLKSKCNRQDSFLKSAIDFIGKNQHSFNDNKRNCQLGLTKESEENSFPRNSIETLNKKIGDVIKARTENSVDVYKKLMSREERSRRKLEFHELWEDHVNYAENLENVYNMPENKDTHKKLLNKQTSDDSLYFEWKNSKQDEKQPKSRLKDSLKVLRVSNDVQNDTSYKNDDARKKITNQFSTLEQTILEKISANNLNKSDEIFGKIENTILNKMTPLQLELKIKEHAKLFKNKSNINKKANCVSKSLSLTNKYSRKKSLRRSSSKISTPLQKLANKPSPSFIVSQQQKRSEEFNRQGAVLTAPYLKKSIAKNDKISRNFVLENILNASVPRFSPQIKRNHQHHADSKLKGNKTLPNIQTSSVTMERKEIVCPQISSPATLYSFQSKVVGESPRFWISIPQSSTRKRVQSSSINSMQVTYMAKERGANSKNVTLLSPTSIDAKAVTNVDAEMYALADEIQQSQPRLENYKRKLAVLGDCVSNCINNINECVNTQENIIGVQNKMKDGLMLQAYTEKVMCRVQTFSLSEAED